MIAARLKELSTWYSEPHADLNRLELLSKLAALEMCGWIEEEFDVLVRDVDAILMKDPSWVDANVISKNSGFTYESHLRKMLSQLAGEFLVRRIETSFESIYPGDLMQLKNHLKQLYKMRCSLAHTSLAAAPLRQYTLNAPSVTTAQYNTLSLLVVRFRAVTLAEVAKI
jgi:hypothetical protein